jgi:hypothetical protein
MTREQRDQIAAKAGESALIHRRAQREHSELVWRGNFLAARKAQEAATDAARSLDSLLDQLDKAD